MPTNQEAMDALLGKLYSILAAKDTITNVEKEQPYISFARPGIPISDKSLDFGFVTMTADQNALAADFADLVNTIPAKSTFWDASGRKVNDEYYKVIDQPVLPVFQLSKDEEEQIARADALLFREDKYQDPLTGEMVTVKVESMLMERYRVYRTQYEQAFDSYQSSLEDYLLRKDTEPLAAEIWARKGPVLKKRVEAAYQMWAAAGKNRVEQAQATIDGLERRGPFKLWADRRERYNSHVRDDFQGGNYLLTKYFPQKFWSTEAGSSWMEFTFKHNEVHKVDTSNNESWGGSGGVSFGFWSFGAGVSRSAIDTYSSADLTNFSLKVELARIPLRRTWLDAGVFSSRSWRFDPQIYSEADNLSDGNSPPAGSMIWLPTAMIVARNLEINIDMSSEQNSYSYSKIQASGHAGWGPFSIRGGYTKETSKTTHDFVFDGSGIKAPGMQIIGFVCQMLPKCPNPDESLRWPEIKPKDDLG